MADPTFREGAIVMDAVKNGYSAPATQTVRVSAGMTQVAIDLETATYSAGLTPEQARFLAKNLYRYAGIVERRLAK